MRILLVALQRLPLGKQLALATSTCCLITTLTLVALATTSSTHTQRSLQNAYGEAVAEQLALRLGSELASGDRLGMTSELARLVDQASILGAHAVDIEGIELAAAGLRTEAAPQFSWPIRIAGDIAGSAVVYLDTQAQDAAQKTFMMTLSGMALILSIAVYGVTLSLSRWLVTPLRHLASELGAVTNSSSLPENELLALQQRVAALPLNLLKPAQFITDNSDQHYTGTAILYLYLRSLPSYLETIDERRLQRYVTNVHRMIHGAAGYYDGKLNVVRQFGIALYFTGDRKMGSPALRAASCAWLIQQAAPIMGEQLRLSVNFGLTVGSSELGQGDERDIYPGLYTQASLDELHSRSVRERDGIGLCGEALNDLDLLNRATVEARADEHHTLGRWSDNHQDLLGRQLQILLRALGAEERPADKPSSQQ